MNITYLLTEVYQWKYNSTYKKKMYQLILFLFFLTMAIQNIFWVGSRPNRPILQKTNKQTNRQNKAKQNKNAHI